LSRADTPEQVYAFGLTAIHDIFAPRNAFVVLPEPGKESIDVRQSPSFQPAWVTDLAIPVFVGSNAVGEFMLQFGAPRSFTDLDYTIVYTIADLTSLRLVNIRETARTQASLQTKNENIAIAAHELRAPLTAIMGAVFLLRSDRKEERELAAQIISRNAKAQEQFIADFLNLSQIDAGRVRLRLAVIDMAEILRQAVEEIRPLAQKSEISLVLNIEGPMMVRGDAQRLWQIFWNLLSNSIRFVAARGEISVTASAENGFASVNVKDDGCGIQPERLAHIFERFEQAHDPRPRIYDGFGLGLAVVKEYAELLGGTVRAHSDGKGKGAAFIVRLPRVDIGS
jgi:signal transduction histidine kinase